MAAAEKASQVLPSNKSHKISPADPEAKKEIQKELSLDKLALTLRIKNIQKRQALQDWLDGEAGCTGTLVDPLWSGKGGYRKHFTLTVPLGPEQPLVHFWTSPFNPKNPYLRLEWNPNRLGKEGHEQLQDMLEAMSPGLTGALLAEGRATRLDVCLDLKGLESKDLLVKATYAKTHRTVFADGKMESRYFNKSTARNQLRAYDKREQLAVAGEPWFRMEAVLKGSNRKLSALPALSQPLERFKVWRVPADIEDVAPWGRTFLDSCLLNGTAKAVKRLPQSLQPQAKAILEALEPVSVEIDLEHWAEALDDLTLLNPFCKNQALVASFFEAESALKNAA